MGDNFCTKLAPFTFLVKDGRHSLQVRNVPLAYTPDLWLKISDMLDFNDDSERRYNYIQISINKLLMPFNYRVHRLTWHGGKIPENEVWINLSLEGIREVEVSK